VYLLSVIPTGGKRRGKEVTSLNKTRAARAKTYFFTELQLWREPLCAQERRLPWRKMQATVRNYRAIAPAPLYNAAELLAGADDRIQERAGRAADARCRYALRGRSSAGASPNRVAAGTGWNACVKKEEQHVPRCSWVARAARRGAGAERSEGVLPRRTACSCRAAAQAPCLPLRAGGCGIW